MTKKNPKDMTFQDKMAHGYYGAGTHNQFRDDALSELGLKNHPKADVLFSKAWDLGHSSGFHEVWYYLQDLSELLK
jgi:hypothetical protein